LKYSKEQFFNTIGAVNEKKVKKKTLFPKINNTGGVNIKETKLPYLQLQTKSKKKKTDKSIDSKH
jgi:hypothetical protein